MVCNDGKRLAKKAPSTMTGGGGGWIQLGMVLGEVGPNIEMWKTGCTAHMESGSCKVIE